MSTKKLIARPKGNWFRDGLVAEDGSEYLPAWGSNDVAVGDTAYLVRRIPDHHSLPKRYEVWPIKVEKEPNYDMPKTWYGGQKYLFIRTKKPKEESK